MDLDRPTLEAELISFRSKESKILLCCQRLDQRVQQLQKEVLELTTKGRKKQRELLRVRRDIEEIERLLNPAPPPPYEQIQHQL
jgi:chromosome segregation ATPase